MNEFFVKGMIAIAAGIATLGVAGAGIGIGMIGSKACESIARQPEASGEIRSSMILSIAFSEVTAIYALFIAIILVFMKLK